MVAALVKTLIMSKESNNTKLKVVSAKNNEYRGYAADSGFKGATLGK